MNCFILIANSIGLFYYHLQRTFPYWQNEKLLFGAAYFSLSDYLDSQEITLAEIKKAFEYAEKGICVIGSYQRSHSSQSLTSINDLSAFLLNLVMQIECLMFNIDTAFSNSNIVNSVITSKNNIKSTLDSALAGQDCLPEMAMGMIIPRIISNIKINFYFMHIVNQFEFTQKDLGSIK
ncbi:MAG: hypothetical protein GX661_03560 [Acholeplasmataceae bacterium]|nr:hypothetical protein [Acholeplasmataceae bacterium]